MEKHKEALLLLLHVALLQVFVVQMKECSRFPTDNLICYNDYSHKINCMWNRKYESDHTDTCTIYAEVEQRSRRRRIPKRDNCAMKLSDVSKPQLSKCNLVFQPDHIFNENSVVNLSLNCSRWNHSVNLRYCPVRYVKLDPPERPNVTQTTVWWWPAKLRRLELQFEMHWKREDQSWSDSSVQQITDLICKDNCTVNLDTLIQDKTYSARTRVRVKIPRNAGDFILSTWSEWSPTARVSLVGRPKPKPVWLMIVAAAALFALILIIIFRTDRTTWVYVIKLIQGPPLPNPAKSFLKDGNVEKWQSSIFTSESYRSSFQPLDIDSVEVTCTVDDIAPSKQELLPLDESDRDGSQGSSSSSFSNPSYSQLCPVPPICSLSAGNLEPCAADSPYGPAGGQGQSPNPQQDTAKQRGKGVDIMQLLSKANNREPLLVISDYERVEKLQAERNRLQSIDSGMCSGEEVSQESLEPDSITQSLDEESESKKQREEGNGDCLQKLFGHSNSGDGFGKGSIEVCSDYEQVQKLQVEIRDDVSVDSDLGISRDQQLSHHHILSTPSTCSPSDPPPPTVSLLPSFTPSPLKFTRPGSSPGLGPLMALIDQTVTSNNSSLKPSADGYLPVTQEES